jgi:hypothetical protein
MVHKEKIIATLYEQYYLFLIGMLAFAFGMGWKMGKDFHIPRISSSMLNSGFLYLISQYQLSHD